MYYASPTPGSTTQEKTANIYIPGQAAPFASAGQVGPPGYAPPQQVLPNGLTATARYAHAPQAYAVVSTPTGHHPGYAATNVYSSMPYHPSMSAIPTSSHAAAYLPTAQYQAGIGYQTAALAAATGRSGPPPPGPPQHYTLPTPVQAGAPLFAAGYTPLPAGIATATPGARTLPMGPGAVATGAAYPPGFAFPSTASSEGNAPPQQMAYAPAGYVPQF